MCIPLSRVPLVGSSVDEWLATTGHMKRVKVRQKKRYRRYCRMPLWMVLSQILIRILCTSGNKKASMNKQLTVFLISISDSTLPSVSSTVIYMIRVGVRVGLRLV